MKTLISILLLTVSLFAQTPKAPRPFVGIAGELMPDGYALGAIEGFTGLMYEQDHVSTYTELAYDNGHKSDDNTAGNSKGHDRYAKQEVNIRFGNWYVGPGVYWHELSTTNYTKSAWNPEVQVGHDLFGENYSARLQGQFMLPSPNEVTVPHCTNCKNHEKGFVFTAWLPSPHTTHHFFVKGDFGVYLFNNVGQTDTKATSYISFGALWRF